MNRIRRLLKMLFVDRCSCILCGTELEVIDGSGFCKECREKLVCIDTFCLKCGRPISDESNYCIQCQNNTRYFNKARSLMEYSGGIEKVLLNFKFHNRRYLADYLSKFITSTYLKYEYQDDIMVAMPLSATRLKVRKYNQVELMLDTIQGLDIPLVKGVLVKTIDNRPQTELSGRERFTNVQGVYKIIDKSAIKGKKVLLVDDIMTTSASVNEASRVLMKAGATQVDVITVATTRYRLNFEIANTIDWE